MMEDNTIPKIIKTLIYTVWFGTRFQMTTKSQQKKVLVLDKLELQSV